MKPFKYLELYMHKYKITVKDDFFQKELIGEFFGDNQEQATNMALEWYASELDTDIDAIEILSINKI